MIRGAHGAVWHALTTGIEEAQEVTATDIAGPTKGFAIAHRADHERTHISDDAVGLRLIRFVANRLAKGAEGALIPELIATPTDEAKLRVRCCGHATPVTIVSCRGTTVPHTRRSRARCASSC